MRARLHDQRGSFLVEVMVSATIVLVVGLGVLKMVDRTNEISGEQRTQAIVGNIAQAELDAVKAYPLSKLNNLSEQHDKTVSGVVYSITNRAYWINDATMTANCTTGATADYLKIRTTVTHASIGSRRPAVLDTILAPPVRAFSADEGSLAVLVKDRNNVGVPGLTVNLAGPKSFGDVTNANGCVLWGYLPAGSGYTTSFSRAGWVMPDGAATGGGPATIIGDVTNNVRYQFDRGGSIRTNFKVRTTAGALIDTYPKLVRVDNGTSGFSSKTYDIGTTSSLDTAPGGLLFPFANPYSVYADCALTKPPTPTSAAVTPGGVIQAADTVLPAMHVTVTNNTTAVVGATVRVLTPCPSVYQRTTITAGKLADPGFPYGTGFTVCASNGTRKRVLTARTNTNFAAAGTPVALDIGTSGSTTSSPNSCP